jgi:hypothetical protein
VVIAREVLAQPKLMLVGQPTRGVDIGTIESIHTQLLALRDAAWRSCWCPWNWKKCGAGRPHSRHVRRPHHRRTEN